MNKYKIIMTENGNKALRITPENGKRGFSIQTNGNLNSLHNEPKGTIIPDSLQISEIIDYVYNYGTKREKTILVNQLSAINEKLLKEKKERSI